jgi:putative oxidoreductase
MAADVPDKWRTIAIWALRVVLGPIFLAVGTTKLTGTGNIVEYFAAIGWGQWFRYLTGVLDIAGAALLFVPRWTCYGAVVLTCSVGLGTLISLTVLRGNPTWGAPAMVLVPLVLTLLAHTRVADSPASTKLRFATRVGSSLICILSNT